MRHLAVAMLLAACGGAPDDELFALAQRGVCSRDSDCCLVIAGCKHAMYVVDRSDFPTAKRLAGASGSCEACPYPRVEVRCNANTNSCESSAGFMSREVNVADHCGSDVPGSAETSRHETVIACSFITPL
jgi:hypothetical protein